MYTYFINMINLGWFVLFLLFQVNSRGCILNANIEKIISYKKTHMLQIYYDFCLDTLVWRLQGLRYNNFLIILANENSWKLMLAFCHHTQKQISITTIFNNIESSCIGKQTWISVPCMYSIIYKYNHHKRTYMRLIM